MQTKFDKVSSTLANLTVEVGEEDYKGLVDKKLKEYAKTAQVKGFRPGHVPLQYIKSIYGKGVLVDEVIKVASDAVNSTIQENKLNVVGEPTPKEDAYKIDWAAQKEFVFEYEIGFASDFVVDLEKLPTLTQYEIQPSEKQINETIEDLKNRFGVETEPEEAEIGDIIFGKLSQESTDFMFQSGIPTDKVKPETQKLFVGLEKGSSLKLDIQTIFETDKELGFATGKSDEDAAALQGEFEFVVEKITRMKPSELTQELFDKVLGPGKATSEEEFLNQLTEIIKGNYSRESDFLLDFDVDKMLLDSTPIELPTEFLKKWLVEINQGKATVEDVEKEYDSIARGLKLDLIRTEIAKQNDLKIQYDDVLEEVKNEIRGYFGQQGGFEGMEEFIDSMAKKQLGEKNNEATKKHYEKAFGRKVLSFVKEKVKKETKTVMVEEFNEIASEKYKV
ncbi:trigger factor [Lacihabitans soyangensis]|uniref:Trigger factor n=1 Tax=Lacihabitans soyangensis TaxID=869394 RepID=A0AAE3KVV1_9BACT|nr:trigger factor [Lacihabitans soyangensis]MCP9761785.1 trigger factor [Lacihabitans soyangensis]